MKLLFDVHCAGTYLGSRAEIDKDHQVICVGQISDLPQDMKDEEIARYALEKGYTVVTKDIDMVKLCIDQKVPVYVLKGNYIFHINGARQLIGRPPPKELFSQN